MPYDESQSLFYAALAAEALYAEALQSQYGHMAGAMRDRTDELPEHLKALARAKTCAEGRYLSR